jgi:hypothetical protein
MRICKLDSETEGVIDGFIIDIRATTPDTIAAVEIKKYEVDDESFRATLGRLQWYNANPIPPIGCVYNTINGALGYRGLEDEGVMQAAIFLAQKVDEKLLSKKPDLQVHKDKSLEASGIIYGKIPQSEIVLADDVAAIIDTCTDEPPLMPPPVSHED